MTFPPPPLLSAPPPSRPVKIAHDGLLRLNFLTATMCSMWKIKKPEGGRRNFYYADRGDARRCNSKDRKGRRRRIERRNAGDEIKLNVDHLFEAEIRLPCRGREREFPTPPPRLRAGPRATARATHVLERSGTAKFPDNLNAISSEFPDLSPTDRAVSLSFSFPLRLAPE